MKVNFVTQNYNPNYQRNNVHFGQTQEERKQQYINAANGSSKDKETGLGGDFPYYNVVEFFLTNNQDAPCGSGKPMSPKSQASCDLYLAAVCGDCYDGDPYDDLYRFTY